MQVPNIYLFATLLFRVLSCDNVQAVEASRRAGAGSAGPGNGRKGFRIVRQRRLPGCPPGQAPEHHVRQVSSRCRPPRKNLSGRPLRMQNQRGENLDLQPYRSMLGGVKANPGVRVRVRVRRGQNAPGRISRSCAVDGLLLYRRTSPRSSYDGALDLSRMEALRLYP